jgi:hypothetical protein
MIKAVISLFITLVDLSHPDDVAPVNQPLVPLKGQPALGATQLKGPAGAAQSKCSRFVANTAKQHKWTQY